MQTFEIPAILRVEAINETVAKSIAAEVSVNTGPRRRGADLELIIKDAKDA